MSLAVSIGGGPGDLLTAIGLIGPDGRLDGTWFDDPIRRARRVLADPGQRAALLRMLDELVPPATARPGWHPLLDEGQIGNVYLTVEDDVIGVAGALEQDVADDIHVAASVRLPLVDVSGDLRPIAGTADGPVRLGVALTFADPGSPVRGVSADITIDADLGAGLTLQLTGVDLGAGPVDIEVDSNSLGGDLVHAVQVLLDEALKAATGDPRLQRFAEHVFALLGLRAGVPALPLDQLVRRPEAVREWLIDIVDTPGTLVTWATHLAGLIGVDRPVSGAATVADPFRGPLLAVGPVELDLVVAVTDTRELQLGLSVRVDAGPADLDASATVLTVPLGGGPVQVVAHAAVLLAAGDPLIANGTAVHVDTVQAGFRLDAGRVQPWLALTGVVLDTVPHGTVDLTDADAVTGVVTAQVEHLFTDAFGATAQAQALLVLLGLEPADAAHPQVIAPLDLLRAPLPALAGHHRALLASGDWSAMLSALGTLLGLPNGVNDDADGTDARPWLLPLASAGPVTLSLAAWNSPDATTQGLRLGLHAAAAVAPFTTELRSELLAVDLPATGPGRIAFVAEQRVLLRAAPLGPVTTPLGLTAGVDAVIGTARWKPGSPLTWSVEIAGLSVRLGEEAYGPYTWTWPDGTLPDLGPVGLGLVRLLMAEALHEWGGDATYVLGALLGVHRGLPALPADWPVLEAPGGLSDILSDPGPALRDLARRLLTEVSSTGQPFARNVLRTVGALLRSWTAPAGTRPDVDVTVTGSGGYDDPWAIPLPATGGEGADLLVWLDPDGPPGDWLAGLAARAVAVTSGVQLSDLLGSVAAFDARLRAALDGRTGLGAGLDALASWLRDGDGKVPLAAQLPAGWTAGATVAAAHDLLPRDASVIAQVQAQLATWAAPAVFVTPGDAVAWADLAPDAVPVDLRALPDPRDVDLSTITASSTLYTAALLSGAGLSEVDQLERAVRRIRELTGVTTVALVAHSTAGVTARLLAAAHPELIAGVVTVGTPHAASPLTPLTDPSVAAALRVAAQLVDPISSSGVGSAVSSLAAALEVPLDTTFTAVAANLPDVTVPRLAIGSALGGDPIGLLAGAVLTSGADAGALPTHAGFGVRIKLDVPAGDIALDAHARVDLARLRLDPAAPEPARPSTAAHLELRATRADGWLVGAELAGAGARVRWAEAGVTITPSGASTWLRLHDAGADVSLAALTELVDAARTAAATARDAEAAVLAAVDDAARTAARVVADAANLTLAAAQAARDAAEVELRRALDALIAELAAAAAGSPARTLLDLLRAAGLVFDSADGIRAAAAGITALVDAPAATLAAASATLRTALQQAFGSLTVSLGSLPLELVLAADAVRLRTTADLTLAGPLRARFDATLATAALRLNASAAVVAGPVELVAGTDGTLTLAAPPWLEPLALRPLDVAVLEQRVLDLLPRLSVSAAVSVLLGSRVAGALGPVDVLLRDPVGWLRRADAFGTSAGGLDGAKINDLLKTLANAVDLDATNGLGLPGGYLLSASGTDPARISLAGTFGSPATATLAVDVAIDVHQDRAVTLAATVAATLVLPGQWGTVTITFGLDSTGVGLLVTPQQNAQPIRLLPNVDGLGLLVGGATALLPKVLQDGVAWLRTQAGTHEVLDVVLEIAAAFGLYADDVAGFTDPARVARLRAMLEPGWLETQVADSAALAALLEELCGQLTLPAGHTVSRVEDRIRWAMAILPGATVSVELGWGAGGTPQVVVAVTGLDTGPVVITEARLGWLDGLSGRVRLTVDPGGEFAFFAPEISVDASGTGLAARILPLGDAAAAHCAIDIVPTPGVVLDADGGLQLVTAWLVPLVSRFVLPLVEGLLDTDFWTGGPSARDVLQGGQLLDPAAAQTRLENPLPQLPQLGLGALGALVNGAVVHLTTTLDLIAISDSGRLGLRVAGTVPIDSDDVDVTVLFGRTRFADPWLTDGGVTLWILREDAAATPPFALDPGLDIRGLGVDVRGDDGTLIEGPVTIGGLAAVVFADLDFLDAAGHLAFAVTNPGGAVELNQAKIVLDSGDADSFVAKLLPKELQAGFSAALAYRNGALELHGGTGSADGAIELTFELDLNVLDVIFLRELFLRLGVDNGVDALAAISGNASLGPVAVTVDRVGLRVHVNGSAVSFGFKPPDGFGLSMDVSVVKLGGFLLVDEEHGRYVGALEIAVLKKFSLTAIGIVTTKKPDGSPGFSLLMLVTIQLPVPIPIGYGFFFAGAGGLLGLNRGMDVDRIRTGLRNGTADSILFPTDIVRRIDVIVRDLEESFPQAEGHFLIAPMAFIQWMNPALVSLKVGVIIEISPQPNIAILGVLQLALPTPDEAVVSIKVAFLGAIDIGAGLLSFDASIYDSFIGYGDFKLTLEGDIAIRLSWGAHPDLVASIGGFHPNYKPDASLKLPAMRRLTLSLLKDNPRITLKLYFAVTSNTVQFGASLELYVGVEGFSISGDMGFDVLVQIAPFLIDAHMWAHLAVKAGSCDICSISLDLSLRGPTPWLAHGTASFSILFISIDVEVEARFGDERATSLPSVAVLDRLEAQLNNPANWTAEVDVASPSVSLFAVTGLVIDAGGQLSVRQNLIPLATDIGLVGAAPPSDIRRAEITALTVGAESGFDTVTAAYAPSTFAGAPTKDADRLRAPAFEQRPTGARSKGGDALVSSVAVGYQTAYERIILDDPDPSEEKVTPPVHFGQLARGGAAGSSAAAKARSEVAERGSVLAAAKSGERFAVTALGDLTPLGGGELLSRADAESRAAVLGRHVQIVPEVQLG